MDQHCIYIVFSSTPYTIGRIIRGITREEYNHVSIALDPELKQMYGFARRHYRLPLYGGFVKEYICRYHVKKKSARIRICRLEATAEQYARITEQLSKMCENKEHYLYNHLSVLASVLHRPVHLRDAYTCVEFAVQILKELGIQLDSRKYYSVGDLEKMLRPHSIFTGPIPQTDIYDTAFFAANPVPHPVLVTLAAFFALFKRFE